MYSNAIVKHLLNDIEEYKRRNYNVDLQIDISLKGGTSYYFTPHDTFQIVDLEFLSVEETKNGVPLKNMIRCDAILAYNFSIIDDSESYDELADEL